MALLIIICVEAILFSYITVNKRFVVTKDELNDKVGYNDYTMEVLKYLQSHDKSFYRINNIIIIESSENTYPFESQPDKSNLSDLSDWGINFRTFLMRIIKNVKK